MSLKDRRLKHGNYDVQKRQGDSGRLQVPADAPIQPGDKVEIVEVQRHDETVLEVRRIGE